MMRILSLAALVVLSALTLAICLPDADGCAPVGRREDSIRIAEENAIIVWDPIKKIEHFIRSASFDTKSPDFGFLVPTPAQPILAEVKGGIFRDMDAWIQPRTVEQFRFRFEPILNCVGCMKSGSAKKSAATPGVRILAEQKVAGFNATVLEADDTDSLGKWITDHGYSSDPELQSWLAPYVLAKWKITAFKIIQDPKTGELAATKPVRMSFATERPFFPYREPEGKSVNNERKQPSKPAPTEIDGIWTVESAEGDAKTSRELQGTNFWFGNGVAVGRYLKDTPYSVDASKEPKWLDLGKMQGIYKLNGDTLHWCKGTTMRPSRLDSKEGLLLVLCRAKKAEADAVAAGVAARELERLHGGNRLLRVHFISDSRVEGKLGNNTAWHATVPWSDQLDEEQRKELAERIGVSATDLPAKVWMTTFEDRASPRPGKDEVYFDPAQDRSPIRPPDRIRYSDIWIPFDVLLIGTLVVGYVGFRVFRGRASVKQD